MSIDLSQFHQIFFEESFEGLDVMEQQLVQLEVGSEDLESINTIFRAAHSIKGGSGTFGFQQVADFTHVVESLLDEMRTGEREVTQQALDLLLNTVDVLRAMLVALQDEQDIDEVSVSECHKKLVDFENDSKSDSESEQRSEASQNVEQDSSSVDSNLIITSCWKIEFSSLESILLTGNEPARMFRELKNLGELMIELNDSNLPELDQLQPENLYLSWTLILESDCSKSDIDEVFEWVVDDCQLSINQVDVSPFSLSNLSVEQNNEVISAEATIESKESEEVEEAGAANKIEADKPKPPKPAVSNSPIQKKENKSSKLKSSSNRSIRVDIQKVDELINRVGELVITQSMLAELGQRFTAESVEKLREGLTQLEQNTRELQESVMGIRMLPISFAFNRFPRLVRDVSNQLGKEVELVIKGENTELDKTVMEQISDPLVHIVRNSLDHGFEKPDERETNGKNRQGTLTLDAYHQGGEIIIEISDDGRGLNRIRIIEKAVERGLISENEQIADEDVWQLIFEPGFSTADSVSDLSGRGVGMDVVKRNITSLGGTVDMFSTEGHGTRILIRLPLTLAILEGQLIKVADEIFIVPLMAMVESLVLDQNSIKSFGNNGEMHQLREQFLPLIDLNKLLKVATDDYVEPKEKLLLVAESEGSQYCLIIDDLLTQQQVVVKSLEANFRTIQGVSGATILGNGRVALILDIAGLIKATRLNNSTHKIIHAN